MVLLTLRLKLSIAVCSSVSATLASLFIAAGWVLQFTMLGCSCMRTYLTMSLDCVHFPSWTIYARIRLEWNSRWRIYSIQSMKHFVHWHYSSAYLASVDRGLRPRANCTRIFFEVGHCRVVSWSEHGRDRWEHFEKTKQRFITLHTTYRGECNAPTRRHTKNCAQCFSNAHRIAYEAKVNAKSPVNAAATFTDEYF